MYRVLLVYMLTSIYAGLENLKNLEQFTSIYADKMVRRRRKKSGFEFSNDEFWIENRDNSKQIVQKSRLRRAKVPWRVLQQLYHH